MKKILKNDTGITLIALITTIVLLILLAGVSIGAAKESRNNRPC